MVTAVLLIVEAVEQRQSLAVRQPLVAENQLQQGWVLRTAGTPQ